MKPATSTTTISDKARKVFSVFSRHYPNSHGKLDTAQTAALLVDWSEGLAEVAGVRVDAVLKALIRKPSAFAPNLGQFIAMCKELEPSYFGAPAISVALRECQNAHHGTWTEFTEKWSHPAVGLTYQKYGSSWLSASHNSNFFDEFAKTYCRVFFEWLEKPSQPMPKIRKLAAQTSDDEKRAKSELRLAHLAKLREQYRNLYGKNERKPG